MNIQNLMAQANKIKKDVEKKRAEIDKTTFEGNSEFVKLLMNGKKEILDLNIKKEVLKDAEDLEALEDMILIAFNDAMKKVDEKTKKELGAYGSDLNGLI